VSLQELKRAELILEIISLSKVSSSLQFVGMLSELLIGRVSALGVKAMTHSKGR
jgi:hypothetical protein